MIGAGFAFLLIRHMDRVSRLLHRALYRWNLRGSALIGVSIEWWISEAEIVTMSAVAGTRYDWTTITRVIETRHFFIMISRSTFHDYFPVKAFRSVEDVDRFIALAREKVLEYDVIKPIEYKPALKEKHSSLADL